MEGRRTDNRHVTVETQISRDGDPEQPDLVASCDSVCAQLQSWTQALELGQAVSRPSPKELSLVNGQSMANFDPLQNQNPRTDCNKMWYN